MNGKDAQEKEEGEKLVELAGKTSTIILQIADDWLSFYHRYSLKLMCLNEEYLKTLVLSDQS